MRGKTFEQLAAEARGGIAAVPAQQQQQQQAQQQQPTPSPYYQQQVCALLPAPPGGPSCCRCCCCCCCVRRPYAQRVQQRGACRPLYLGPALSRRRPAGLLAGQRVRRHAARQRAGQRGGRGAGAAAGAAAAGERAGRGPRRRGGGAGAARRVLACPAAAAWVLLAPCGPSAEAQRADPPARPPAAPQLDKERRMRALVASLLADPSVGEPLKRQAQQLQSAL
jgi:hypothetical protein